ncbi:MAG: hypothetical protein ABR577_08160 [Pyrinomonadaceae bacterium]
MSEDPTKDLHSAGSFEQRVLAEFSAQREMNTQLLDAIMQVNSRVGALEARANARFDALDTRLTGLETRLITLEDKVDVRMRETRPIWEGVQTQLTQVQTELKELNRQFKMLIHDSFNLRARVNDLEDRLPAV